MCLALLAVDAHSDCALVVAANRDEFYERPTAPAAFWEEAPHLLGGRDLRSGGTWLGITRGGRVALVTNYREGVAADAAARSRGALVREFLLGAEPADAFLDRLRPSGHLYGGFNLVFGTVERLLYFSNRGAESIVTPGFHVVSNGLLDTPWPKALRGRAGLERLLAVGAPREAIFALLRDDAPAPDADLPDTGVGLDLERLLSPPFIRTPQYGTRSSTLLTVARDGTARFAERTFLPGTAAWTDVAFELTMAGVRPRM